jgi:hypothetical protein
MSGKTANVGRGLRRAGVWLLGFATVCVILGGLLVIFFPNDVHVLGIPGPYPPIAGWAALMIATLVMVLTTSRWVKALPGILVLATFNGVLTVFTGHLTNAPDLPISKLVASILTLLLALSAVLSFTFRLRDLNWVDQIALLAVVFSLAWGVLDNARTLMAFGTMLFALFFAWLCDYLNFRIAPLPWTKRGGASHRED